VICRGTRVRRAFGTAGSVRRDRSPVACRLEPCAVPVSARCAATSLIHSPAEYGSASFEVISEKTAFAPLRCLLVYVALKAARGGIRFLRLGFDTRRQRLGRCRGATWSARTAASRRRTGGAKRIARAKSYGGGAGLDLVGDGFPCRCPAYVAGESRDISKKHRSDKYAACADESGVDKPSVRLPDFIDPRRAHSGLPSLRRLSAGMTIVLDVAVAGRLVGLPYPGQLLSISAHIRRCRSHRGSTPPAQ